MDLGDTYFLTSDSIKGLLISGSPMTGASRSQTTSRSILINQLIIISIDSLSICYVPSIPKKYAIILKGFCIQGDENLDNFSGN